MDAGLAGALLIKPGGIAQPKVIMSETLNLFFIVPAISVLGLYSQQCHWKWLLLSEDDYRLGLHTGAGCLLSTLPISPIVRWHIKAKTFDMTRLYEELDSST